MTKPSKDNSGEKIYVPGKNPHEIFLKDNHGHFIVDHDLFNHDGLTKDGIAEAFIEFAKKENLSFFDHSSFDEVKYNFLLKELEISEINFSWITKNNLDFRIDSEYFKQDFLKFFNYSSNKNLTLEDIAIVKGGKRLPLGENFSTEGTPYIRAEDVKNNFVDYSNSPRISKRIYEQIKKYQTQKYDVLLTIVGNSIGDVGFVMFDLDICNLTENCVRLKSKKINPFYLFVYFLSKYGQIQIEREKVGTAQPKLAIERIRRFNIFVPKVIFQEKIAEIVKSAHEKLNLADEKYKYAEKILSEALGLENFAPSTENISVKNFSASFGATGRLDAEFYQPKYDDIEKILKSFETTSISSEYEIFKNNGTNYSNGIDDVGVIKTKQVTNQGVNVDGVESYFSKKVCEDNDSIFLENGDVIFASMGVGSLGKISLFIYDGEKKFVTDSTLKIYRAKENSKVLPSVLCLFIQSSIGQEIIYKYVVGSTGIINIYDSDIDKIPIPILPIEIQEKIAAQIEESFKLRAESKRLLEFAKKLVEVAIEEGENEALKIL